MKYLVPKKFVHAPTIITEQGVDGYTTNLLAHVNIQHSIFNQDTALQHDCYEILNWHKKHCFLKFSCRSFIMYSLYSIYRLFPAILGIQSPTAGATP
jgi:hypothetical protein